MKNEMYNIQIVYDRKQRYIVLNHFLWGSLFSAPGTEQLEAHGRTWYNNKIGAGNVRMALPYTVLRICSMSDCIGG